MAVGDSRMTLRANLPENLETAEGDTCILLIYK